MQTIDAVDKRGREGSRHDAPVASTIGPRLRRRESIRSVRSGGRALTQMLIMHRRLSSLSGLCVCHRIVSTPIRVSPSY
jgi:predicted membrane chloride channel (bestrophin family)